MGSDVVEHPKLKATINEVVEYGSCCERAREQPLRVPARPGRKKSFVRPAELLGRVG